MKYNRLSPRQGLGLAGGRGANFKQWSEGGSSRSRAPVPRYRYRSGPYVRVCFMRHFIPFPSISYPLWDELTKLDLSAGAEMVSRCGISKSVYDSWPSWTFTLKCCPGPEMVFQQSLSRNLLASQDLLFSKLGPFSLSFLSSLVLGQASPSVSKTRTPKSKIWPPKLPKKHEAVAESFVGPSPFSVPFIGFPMKGKHPGKKFESSMHGDLPVVKQD